MLRTFLILAYFTFCVTCWPSYELYTKSSPDKYNLIQSSNLLNYGFNHSKETKFLVHGFSSDSSALIKIKDELLKKYDVNVIAVNWKDGAVGPNYFLAFLNAKIVSFKMSLFIKDSKIIKSKVHCIGHSLGAHICGFTSKSERLNRISGLDPAGPLFKGTDYYHRLDKSDADFVDVIHTDIDLGIQDPIGHLNFYPNGGTIQSGCLTKSNNLNDIEISQILYLRLEPKGDILGHLSCSHTRAHLLYAQSISNCRFKSVFCSNYNDFKAGRCARNDCSLESDNCPSMGYHTGRNFTNGNYYLDTTSELPFC